MQPNANPLTSQKIAQKIAQNQHRQRPCRACVSRHSGTGLWLMTAWLILSACGSGNGGTNLQDVGGFRVINAVSDSPPITFFLENTSLGALQFGQATAFQNIAEGNFDVNAQFAQLDSEVIALTDDERISIDVEEQTTFVLAGSVAAPVFIEIELENPNITNDTTELQILNTAGAGTVDVFLDAPEAGLSAPIATVNNNAVTPILISEEATRRLQVTATGSTDVIFDSGEIVLPVNARILLHIRPYFGPTGDGPTLVDAAMFTDNTTSTFPNTALPVEVRVANAISDLSTVDVAIEAPGTVANIVGLAASAFSNPLTLNPGAAEIVVSMETDPGTVLVSNSPALAGGERRTLIAAGSFSANTTTGRLAVDPQRPIATVAQINFMHGAASTGDVDVYLLTGGATPANTTPTISSLSLLANSNVTILAGDYDLFLTAPGEDTELADPISFTVENTALYSILLTDAEGGGTPPQIIQGPNFE